MSEQATYKFRVIRRLPWFWPVLQRRFPGANPKTVCVAYGRALYTTAVMTPDLAEHEALHLKRQGYSYITATWWWVRYLTSYRFRFNEEVLAYQAQYAFAKKYVKDKNDLNRCLVHYGSELAGPTYGFKVSASEARAIIAGKPAV